MDSKHQHNIRDVEDIRKSLIPDEYKPFFNHEFWVYLKPIYNGSCRIGLSECCELDYPCDWHKACVKINTPFTETIN